MVIISASSHHGVLSEFKVLKSSYSGVVTKAIAFCLSYFYKDHQSSILTQKSNCYIILKGNHYFIFMMK